MKKSPVIQKKAILARYEGGDTAIILRFDHSDKETLSQIKTLPGITYYKREMMWVCDVSLKALDKLIYFKFKLDEKLLKLLKEATEKRITPIQPETLNFDLLPFQKIGCGFLHLKDGNALLADDQGLGKTVQALAYLELHPEVRPAVIVCTKSLKLNWQTEAEKWLSECDVEVLSGKPRKIDCEDIIIVGYNVLANETVKEGDVTYEIKGTGWIDYLMELQPAILILDECQKIKNPDAQRTIAAMRLGKDVGRNLCISGTPIENNPIEIFNALSLIDPKQFNNRFMFGKRYCGAKNNGFGWEFKGHSNEQELFKRLQSVMIRRLKQDVLKDLPDKRFSIVPLELDNDREYRQAENDFLEYIANKARNKFDAEAKQFTSKLGMKYNSFLDEERELYVEAAVGKAVSAEELIQIGILKRLASQGKLESAIEWIEDFLETGDKLVVFVHHKFMVKGLMDVFKKIAVKIDGSTSEKNRKLAIDGFQNNPKIQLIIITEAAAEGITLTAASNIAVLEFPWVPGKLDQVIDRIHRIGQKRNVIAHFLMARNSIELRFAEILDTKRKVISKVMDGVKADPEKLILELYDDLKKHKLKLIA